MTAQSLSSHLDAAAASITSPWHFLAVVYAWLASLAGGFIDSPGEREAIEAVVMAAYDKITLGLMGTNVALAGLFVALRSTIKSGLDWILVSLAPPPDPTPGPLPIVIPQGNAAT